MAFHATSTLLKASSKKESMQSNFHHEDDHQQAGLQHSGYRPILCI